MAQVQPGRGFAAPFALDALLAQGDFRDPFEPCAQEDSGALEGGPAVPEERRKEPAPTPAGEEEPGVEDAAGSSSEESERQTHRPDLPRLPARKRERGSERVAKAIHRCPAKKAKWRQCLLDDMFANSTRGSKCSKRRVVEGLAREAAGDPIIYPLDRDVVIDVAGALKGAKYRAADQYLGELRLGHVESGAEVSGQLARVFVGCRRSVLRGLGPPVRAAELPLDMARAIARCEQLDAIEVLLEEEEDELTYELVRGYSGTSFHGDLKAVARLVVNALQWQAAPISNCPHAVSLQY